MNHFFSFEATEENNTSIAIKNNINLSGLDSVIGMNQASFLIIDTSFKLALTERPEATDFINSGYPVNGGERCKSIDRVFELINEIHNLKKKPEQIIAMGGGSLIDLCGYLVLTSMPDCRFTVIPTTPLSQLTGFYKRKFFLNYDRKKDRLFVRGLPDYNLILPDLLRVFQMDDLREAHLVAFSVAIGYDSRFFYLVKRSLDSMVKDKVNWDYLTEMIMRDYDLVITHGNGPQVGNLLLQQDMAKEKIPPFPIDVNDAQTQGSLGYFIAQALGNSLKKRGVQRTIASLVTQIIVNPEDQAFKEPTKPVGPFYSEEEGKQLAEEKGWDFVEDSGRGWRRVVPSPQPLDIVEREVLKDLIEKDVIVIAAGGGGIPVATDENDMLYGVEAVIDKDRASALLALEINADELIILTGVDQVCLNFGKENEKRLDRISITEAKQYLESGQFPKGSMGPKIEAAMKFVSKSGKECLITSMEKLSDALEGKTGTIIYKD